MSCLAQSVKRLQRRPPVVCVSESAVRIGQAVIGGDIVWVQANGLF